MGNVIKHHWNTTVTGGLVTAVLNEPISANDENANEFSVSVQNANFESATCQGFFIRGDGKTIVLDGQVSGKTASVVLAPNCYNVTGRFTITIKVKKGESNTSWLRAEGYVKATSTDDYAFAGDDSAPLDILLEAAEKVDETIEKAEEAILEVENTLASIPEDYTELVEEVGQLSEEIDNRTAVREGGTFYALQPALEDGGLRIDLVAGKKKLTDEAIAGLSYAELFESERNQGITFENGIVSPWRVQNGTPTVTTETYVSKQNSLKCFGSVSQNIINQRVSVQKGRYYFVGAKVNVTRYVSGKAGILQGDVVTAFTNATVGFENIGRIQLHGVDGLSQVFVGTLESADIDAYIDNVCHIDITDFYSMFDSPSAAVKKMFELLDDYIEIKNTQQRLPLLVSARETGFTDAECHAEFLRLMNAKATKIGMSGTDFQSPHGMVKTSLITAQDLMKMAVAAAADRRALDIWSTSSLLLNISGEHKRTVNVANAFLAQMEQSVSAHAKALGGKGGSLIWSDEDADYHRANVSIVDINGKAVALGLCGTGKEVYSNLYNAARDLCYMVKTAMDGGTPSETTNLVNVVGSGGGYAACVIPNPAGAYVNTFTPAKLLETEYAESNGAENQQMPASTSKVMTMLVALDFITDIYAPVVVRTSDIFSGSGSTYYDGDTMTMYDALCTMMMESSNTLANTIAREIGDISLGKSNNK